MPNTKSARKSLRVSVRRNSENRQTKTNLRQVLKATSDKKLPEVFSALDKAAKNHIMHPNKAARLKSRAARQLSDFGKEAEKTVKPTKAVKPKSKAVKKSTAKKTATKKKSVKK
ncbi:MAG: 30S ribosomal protein S20 [bacterium]|nr:30S ribosomal protein S20 [bacterium]